MLQKKRKEATKFSPILEKEITEILVTNGRSFEPFVRTFCYKGENVAKNHLGSLVGIFEVGERTEDSAYIVNFLASVAKKEYFAQGKRGPIESFESALHKINIALAELVKHGNVEWLGKLHGALGVIEKNNLHFSATGAGRILLMRHGSFTDISEGLASTESALHPMKTFVEVSSGHLESSDRLLFASPEIFELFSLEELEKNASRLGGRFPQFLKTALINELDIAGVVYASFSEAPQTPLPEMTQEKSAEPEEVLSLANVFSEQAFLTPSREEAFSESATIPKIEKNEYVDSKTGHIYIQGETSDEKNIHPFWEKMSLHLEALRAWTQSLLGSQRRFFRKIRKQGLIALDVAKETSLVGARKLWRGLRRRLTRRRLSPPALPPVPFSPSTDAVREQDAPHTQEVSEAYPASFPPGTEPSPSPASWFLKGKNREIRPEPGPSGIAGAESSLPLRASLSPFFQNWQKRFISLAKKILIPLQEMRRKAFWGFRLLSRKIIVLSQGLPKRVRLIAIFGGIFFLALGVFGVWFLGERPEKSTENALDSLGATPPGASLIPPEETRAVLAGAPTLLATRDEKVLRPLLLGSSLFLITQSGVLRVADNTFYPLPADTGEITLAAAMEDLQLLFLSTEKQGLLSFSPITRTYTPTSLSLPENAVLQDMGAYLTYLYVLDSAADQIYRFPRATGGFGERVLWLKEPAALEDRARMAVNESIFVTRAGAGLESYFQGRKVRDLETPAVPLEVEAVFTKPGMSRAYALDRKNKRLLVWNTEGAMERQFFLEEFGQSAAFAVNNENTEAYVSTEHQLFLVPFTNSLP